MREQTIQRLVRQKRKVQEPEKQHQTELEFQYEPPIFLQTLRHNQAILEALYRHENNVNEVPKFFIHDQYKEEEESPPYYIHQEKNRLHQMYLDHVEKKKQVAVEKHIENPRRKFWLYD